MESKINYSSPSSVVLLFLAVLLYSCKDAGLRDCAVKVNEITFTKSLNDAESFSSVQADGKLVMKSPPGSDFFNTPDGKTNNATAPVLLMEVNGKKPFTFTATVRPEFKKTYDAGAFYIYVDDMMWQKFAFEMDERNQTRIVTVRTVETSDDNNHDVVEENQVTMKISSDSESIGFYYSTDNVSWQLVRVYKNDFPATIWVGISSQSPMGSGTTTGFENIHFAYEAVKDFRLGI